MFGRTQTSPLFPNLKTTTSADRRVAAKAGKRAHPAPFLSRPDPHFIGDFQRGRKLIRGHLHFGGNAVQTSGRDPWSVKAPDLAFEIDLHGFAWLDDLAAVGDGTARQAAQSWLSEWIERFADGSGPGWSADLAARRALRWFDHAQFLQIGRDEAYRDAFLRGLSQHIEFLAARWRSASDGTSRFEALSAMLFAGLTLADMGVYAKTAAGNLGAECDAQISAEGAMPGRNSEDLMEVFALLTRGAYLLGAYQREVDPRHRAAIGRMVPTLRALRHCDGSLARFHGAGSGAEGRLDTALGEANVKSGARKGLAMGYLRLGGGRVSVIVDGARPPSGAEAVSAHASTLAFEMTSGFQPIVVNCGAGAPFGLDWRRASRKTASHSTLIVAQASSSSIRQMAEHDLLERAPQNVRIQPAQDENESWFDANHDGYVPDFGLIHTRRMALSYNGMTLTGEDKLDAVTPVHQTQFKKAISADPLSGLPYDIRFHLHPDVKAEIDADLKAIELRLKNGETWLFRAFGRAAMELLPSFHLEKNRDKPRSSKQIVLTARVLDYAGDVSWSFTKASVRSVSVPEG